jgi:hypothetical protein
MLIARRASFSNLWMFRWDILVAVGCLGLGVAIVKAPPVAWALVGVLIGLLLFQLPSYVWVIATVLAATTSRGFVATGFVPQLSNFFHFPLAVGAVLVTAQSGVLKRPVAQSLAMGCVALLCLSFVSWLFNTGEILRPFFNWLVFLEPFLIIYALVRVPLPSARERSLWKLALAIPFAQFPLALGQALSRGIGDGVQGTFVGMGAGHHVAGAVALTGTLVCAARGLSSDTFRQRLTWLVAGVLLLIVPILADAKQNIAAFLPALFLLISTFARFRRTGLIVALPIFGLVLLVAYSYDPSLQRIVDRTVMSDVTENKQEALAIITHSLSATPGSWLFGVGPGNSVSRVALMGMESYLNSDSPVTLLGLGTAPLTREVWGMRTSGSLLYSSVTSGISSWGGLLGDLGLVGLGFYVWMGWQLWKHTKKRRGWEAAAARAALVMAGILGTIYSWLEEPGFTLMVALIVGLALNVSENQHASVENLARPQFLPAGWR